MNSIIKKYFIEPLGDYIAWKVISYWKTEAMQEMAWEVFSILGLEELEKIAKEGGKNRKRVGHSNFQSLAEIYAKRLKTMTIKRTEDILHKLQSI